MPLSDKKQNLIASAVVLLSWWIVPRVFPAMSFSVLLLGFCWWLFLLLKRLGASQALRSLVWWAFAIRLGIALFLYLASVHQWPIFTGLQSREEPGFWTFAPDAAIAHRCAQWILPFWKQGMPFPIFTSGSIEYYLWLAGIYWLFGTHPLHGILINIVLSVLNVILFFRITRALSNERTALRAGWLFALWPSNILWATQSLKDPLCIFILLGTLSTMIALWRKTRERAPLRGTHLGLWVLFILGIAATTKFRSYVGVALAVPASFFYAVTALRAVRHKDFFLFRHAATLSVACGLSMMIGSQLPFPQCWVTTEAPSSPISSLATKPAKPQQITPKSSVKTVVTLPAQKITAVIPEKTAVPSPAPPQTSRQASPPPPEKRISPPSPNIISQNSVQPPINEPRRITVKQTARKEIPVKKDLPIPQPKSEQPPTFCAMLCSKLSEYFLKGFVPLRDSADAFSSVLINGAFPSWLNRRRAGILRSGGTSIVYPEVTFKSWGDVILFIPKALMVAWLSPFPSQWLEIHSNSGIFRLFSGGEAVLIYLLFPFFFRGSARMLRNDPINGAMLIGFTVLLSLILGLFIPNIGTIFRLRLSALIPFLILSAIGFEKRPDPVPPT